MLDSASNLNDAALLQYDASSDKFKTRNELDTTIEHLYLTEQFFILLMSTVIQIKRSSNTASINAKTMNSLILILYVQ